MQIEEAQKNNLEAERVKPQPGLDLDLSNGCGHKSKLWPGLGLDLAVA